MFGDRAKEVREAGAEHGVRGKMFPQCRLEILHAGLGRLDADRAQRVDTRRAGAGDGRV